MHTFDAPAANVVADDGRPWWRLMTRYHWFVLAVTALGWMFDCMDQQLFNIARRPAMETLVTDKAQVNDAADYATAIFLFGWGTGGIVFGILGDLIGRARTMMLTILCYSLFTGLSAFSIGFWDFGVYRFLTALGVGGQFAVGVALVAEVVPDRARPFALGMLQALSAIGNITAASVGIFLAYLEHENIIGSAWRVMFMVGAIPAVLAFLIFRRLKEPERWQAATATSSSFRQRLNAYFGALFESPRWAKNAILGLVLASAGIIGLWGIGFFSIDLQRIVFEGRYQTEGMSKVDVKYHVGIWAGITSATLNVGGFFGIYAFSRVTHLIGRRPAFAISLLIAMLSTALVFSQFSSIGDVFWMIPLMGFCQLSLFGGYAIYFPELFPTRLRSTGTSFCYNVARFVAAFGLGMKAVITHAFDQYGLDDKSMPLRYAGITMCAVFFVGLLVLPFLPETKGRPLPE